MSPTTGPSSHSRSPSPRLSPSDLDLVRRETLQATLRGATRTASYNLAAAALLAVLAVSAAGAPALGIALLALGVAGSVWRMSLRSRYLERAAPSRSQLERAWLELQCNAAVTALMWAGASLFLLPRLPAALGVFYMLLLGCALATAAAFMTATPRALPAYAGFQLLALGGSFLDASVAERVIMGLICGFTVLTLSMTSRQIQASTTHLAGKLARSIALQRLRRERERARQLREVARMERVRRQAAESRAHFISRISHELRTPLQVISACGELIQLRRQTAQPERLNEPLDRMLAACEQLLARAGELSDWRQWESADVPVLRQPVELGPLLQDVAADLRPRAETRGLGLQVDLPAGGQTLLGDPARLRAIVQALLANAVKWTARGGASLALHPARDGEVLVVVADSGPGLPAGVRQALARPFSDGDLQVREDGLGIGLVTARMLCAQIGARLDHAERPGGGTEFRLWLTGVPPAQHHDATA